MHVKLSPAEIRHVRQLLAGAEPAAAQDTLSSLTVPELGELLLHLEPEELANLDSVIGTERLADAFAQVEPAEAARLILRFSRAHAAEILEEMEPDDAADVIEELHPGEAEDILAEMDTPEAEEIRELMSYPPDTAGGRMSPQFISLSSGWTVAAAMRQLRAQAEGDVTIYYAYVTDPTNHLVGVVGLRQLVLADPQQRVGDIMRRQVIRLPADTDQEEAARVLMAHDFLALPVVDEAERLVGIITADDVADVLQEEATEDIERLGGSEPLDEPYLRTPLPQLFRKRVPWLLGLFLAGTYTSFVLQAFSGTLERAVALAFFIPLLIGTGGNVGSQIVTTVVRALALGQVSFTDAGRLLARELLLALGVGVLMAAAMLVRAETMRVDQTIVAVVSLSALFIVVWSAFLASILPLVLQRFRIDPAVASAPLIITVIDGTGLFLYLTVARMLLDI